MKNRLLLYLLLIFQLLGLGFMFAYYRVGLESPSVMLRTLPVDPRDLLRGDYMILRYEISTPPANWLQKREESFAYPNDVYVVLRTDSEGFSVIDRVQYYVPRNGQTFLKAKYRNRQLIYDMEKYFVPEGMGTPSGVITVEASVRGDGQPQIKHLFLDGTPYP